MIKESPWDITKREQTQLKLKILEDYLSAWAKIIGERFSESYYYYIDCLAVYKYHKDGIKDCVLGSPIIAQRMGLEIQEQKEKKGKIFKFKTIAIEPVRKNFVDLSRFVKENDPRGKVHIKLIQGNFQDQLGKVINEIGSSPAFFFIDPYGIKYIPKETLDIVIDRAVRYKKTEIF